jgi:hypothetical protein
MIISCSVGWLALSYLLIVAGGGGGREQNCGLRLDWVLFVSVMFDQFASLTEQFRLFVSQKASIMTASTVFLGVTRTTASHATEHWTR